MKIADLVRFQESGFLGTILEISKDFGEYAVVWIHDDVVFANPVHMSLKMLRRTSEMISESR
jgi:hypothetical protein